METPVVRVNREQLLVRREAILNELKYSLKEWNAICKNEDWVNNDWVYRDELSTIAFLLGE